MNKNHIIIVLLTILLFWATFAAIKNGRSASEKTDLIEALGDSLEVWKAEDGTNKAKIKVLETQSTKAFLSLASLNNTINDLQDLVKENKKLLKKKGSATIIKTETKVDTFVKTKVDTFNRYPVYTGRLEDKWISLISISGPDTTKFTLISKSELGLVIGEEKQGFFKKKKPYAIVNDKNPHTGITDMRVYQVSGVKKKPFAIGPSIGFNLFINESNELKVKPAIGFVVVYNLIGI